MTRKAEGVCKLTGLHGPFVKSHIIPRAFTPSYGPNKPMIDWGGGQHPPSRRWDGLYDSGLVTREGEDILEEYDAWAVSTFRKHHMVWSSWGLRVIVPPPHELIHDDLGHRIIEGIDPKRLRLFFASLLWRAAASSRRELDHIKLPEADLRALAASLRSGEPLGDAFYPVTLSQFSTMGPIHHAHPVSRRKQWFDEKGNPTHEVTIYRFYFDGLVAHFHLPVKNGPAYVLGVSGVGNEPTLCVHTVQYETSFQRIDLTHQVVTSFRAWPDKSSALVDYLRRPGTR